jgi:RsiW-degrading membrane proteinase PrsW (M82 family)
VVENLWRRGRQKKRRPDEDLKVARAGPGQGASIGVLRLLPSPAAGVMVTRSGGDKQRKGYVAPIAGEVTSIGRGLQNSVVLLDPTVSREHAILQHEGAGWLIRNVSTGQPLTLADGEIPPGGEGELSPGGTVQIGRSRLALLAPREDQANGWQFSETSREGAGREYLEPGVTLQYALQGQRYPQLRWLIGAAALVVLTLCGLATLGRAAVAGQNALETGGPARVLVSLAIPLLPALGVTLLIGIFDRYEREPWVTLLGAFAWGAIIAIPPTLVLEHSLGALLESQLPGGGSFSALAYAGGQAAVAGVIEEIVKGAGLVALLIGLRDEFDNVTDGVLYGLLIGAGFAVVENFVYFSLSPSNELPYLVLARIGLGWLSHSAFTALFGAGLGFAREMGRKSQGGVRLLYPLAGLLGAILLHTLFDFVVFASTWLGGQSVDGVRPISPFLVMLLVLVLGYGPVFAAQAALLKVLLAALEREAETVRQYLADELLQGVVLPDEYLIVQDASLRGAAERSILGYGGLRAYLTARAFYQTATGLAFRKWHVAQGDPEKVAARQPEDAYRERLARLRVALSRQLG